MFFGATRGLDTPCLRLRVKAGEAILIPAGMIFMVWAKEDTVALVAHYLDFHHLPQIVAEYIEEREARAPLEECFPCSSQLLLMVLSAWVDGGLLWGHECLDVVLPCAWQAIKTAVGAEELPHMRSQLMPYYVSSFHFKLSV
jgi:hypothetical protein